VRTARGTSEVGIKIEPQRKWIVRPVLGVRSGARGSKDVGSAELWERGSSCDGDGDEICSAAGCCGVGCIGVASFELRRNDLLTAVEKNRSIISVAS
jgi:hypothetical protein